MSTPKSESARKLGVALRAARQQLSQVDVAEAAGIDPRNYGQYERGETDIGLSMLVRLAHVLGTSVEELVAGISAGDVAGVADLPSAADVRRVRAEHRRPFRRGHRTTR